MTVVISGFVKCNTSAINDPAWRTVQLTYRQNRGIFLPITPAMMRPVVHHTNRSHLNQTLICRVDEKTHPYGIRLGIWSTTVHDSCIPEESLRATSFEWRPGAGTRRTTRFAPHARDHYAPALRWQSTRRPNFPCCFLVKFHVASVCYLARTRYWSMTVSTL